MVDTHCHLDDASFDADRDDVVARARAAGVTHIVVPAVRPRSFARTLAMASYPEVRIALGIHPQVVPFLDDEERDQAIRELPRRLVDSGSIAVGECGLDGATGDRAEQERLFRAQIAVAREVKLPLIVHVLRAHDTAPRILAEERAGEVGGVLHSYSGGVDLVGRYRDLGLCFSFAGPVTYANARRPVEAARAIPSDRLMAETDAPDQAPEPHRGRRSEPAFVARVYQALPVDEPTLTANARRLFRL